MPTLAQERTHRKPNSFATVVRVARRAAIGELLAPSTPPIVDAVLRTGDGCVLVLDCPFCSRSHRHSASPGQRLSHCARNPRSYVLRIVGGHRAEA